MKETRLAVTLKHQKSLQTFFNETQKCCRIKRKIFITKNLNKKRQVRQRRLLYFERKDHRPVCMVCQFPKGLGLRRVQEKRSGDIFLRFNRFASLKPTFGPFWIHWTGSDIMVVGALIFGGLFRITGNRAHPRAAYLHGNAYVRPLEKVVVGYILDDH